MLKNNKLPPRYEERDTKKPAKKREEKISSLTLICNSKAWVKYVVIHLNQADFHPQFSLFPILLAHMCLAIDFLIQTRTHAHIHTQLFLIHLCIFLKTASKRLQGTEIPNSLA